MPATRQSPTVNTFKGIANIVALFKKYIYLRLKRQFHVVGILRKGIFTIINATLLDCMSEGRKTRIALNLGLMRSIQAQDCEALTKNEIQCIVSHKGINGEAVKIHNKSSHLVTVTGYMQAK